MGVTAHADDCAGGVALGVPDSVGGDVRGDVGGDTGEFGPGCGGDGYGAELVGASVGALDSGEGASGAGP